MLEVHVERSLRVRVPPRAPIAAKSFFNLPPCAIKKNSLLFRQKLRMLRPKGRADSSDTKRIKTNGYHEEGYCEEARCEGGQEGREDVLQEGVLHEGRAREEGARQEGRRQEGGCACEEGSREEGCREEGRSREEGEEVVESGSRSRMCAPVENRRALFFGGGVLL